MKKLHLIALIIGVLGLTLSAGGHARVTRLVIDETSPLSRSGESPRGEVFGEVVIPASAWA